MSFVIESGAKLARRSLVALNKNNQHRFLVLSQWISNNSLLFRISYVVIVMKLPFPLLQYFTFSFSTYLPLSKSNPSMESGSAVSSRDVRSCLSLGLGSVGLRLGVVFPLALKAPALPFNGLERQSQGQQRFTCLKGNQNMGSKSKFYACLHCRPYKL